MGTRGIVGHVVKGRKKGSYNHFDSYPSKLGVEIVEFLKSLSPEQLEHMKANLVKIEWVHDRKDKADEESQKRYEDAGFSDFDVSTRERDDWYCVLRNVQGAASLPNVLSGQLGHLIDSTNFEDESSCEAVYWIDWDEEELRVRWHDVTDSRKFGDLDVEWMKQIQDRWN